MRRLAALVAFLVVVPATAAWADEIDDLLTRAREATYSAELAISCSTPDGVRDAVVRITQVGGEISVSSSVTDDVRVEAGAGTWTVRREDGSTAEVAVDAGGKEKSEPLYTVEDERDIQYLGRDAVSYLLIRDDQPRGGLTFDAETGALVETITFTIDGEVYCERRFISFDADVEAAASDATVAEGTPPVSTDESALPENVAGFELLDQYEDEEGLRFAYYSDGFFSFALFETPGEVELPEATAAELASGTYLRSFGAGQVTYVWEILDGGMALVGDLPPDLHEEVLSEMPHPEDPGFLRRWWRSLFG